MFYVGRGWSKKETIKFLVKDLAYILDDKKRSFQKYLGGGGGGGGGNLLVLFLVSIDFIIPKQNKRNCRIEPSESFISHNLVSF